MKLTDAEVEFLGTALYQWAGPARCSPELARALGYDGPDEFLNFIKSMVKLLDDDQASRVPDWGRVLVAAEIVFASEVLGAALDWETCTGISDAEALDHLRSVQVKYAQMKYRQLP